MQTTNSSTRPFWATAKTHLYHAAEHVKQSIHDTQTVFLEAAHGIKEEFPGSMSHIDTGLSAQMRVCMNSIDAKNVRHGLIRIAICLAGACLCVLGGSLACYAALTAVSCLLFARYSATFLQMEHQNRTACRIPVLGVCIGIGGISALAFSCFPGLGNVLIPVLSLFMLVHQYNATNIWRGPFPWGALHVATMLEMLAMALPYLGLGFGPIGFLPALAAWSWAIPQIHTGHEVFGAYRDLVPCALIGVSAIFFGSAAVSLGIGGYLTAALIGLACGSAIIEAMGKA